MLGYKHTTDSIDNMKLKKVSPEHKLLLSLIDKNKIVSDETRTKLSAAIYVFKKRNYLSEEKLAKLKTDYIKPVGVEVNFTNTETNEITKFNNKTEAGQFIGVTRQAITNYIKINTPLKNILKIKKD